MPGKSVADRAVEAAIELKDAISNFKHDLPLKDIPSTQMAALTKLAEFFRVATNLNNQKVTTIAQKGNTRVPQEVGKTKPLVISPRVVIILPSPPPSPGVKIILPPPTPSPRVQTPIDKVKEVHIIPDSEVQDITLAQPSPQIEGMPHIIPPEDDSWGGEHKSISINIILEARQYILFAAAILKHKTFTHNFRSSPEFFNRVLHPKTGAVCT